MLCIYINRKLKKVSKIEVSVYKDKYYFFRYNLLKDSSLQNLIE